MTEFQISDSDPYVPGTMPHFVNYVEDIYVGYKYWETAAAEGIIDYDQMVQYPFGHGLSYTSFTQQMGPISESNGTITFDVTVTNTGSVAGKDVVEVYYNPPYTNGGIEKASANLVAFDKTDLLEPGANQTLTLSFNVEDMASYDMSGNGGYVLERGDYIISINRDSHNIIDSQTYTVAADVDYTNGRSTDQAAPVNLFDFAKGEIEYLSRTDGFANFAAATAALNNNFTNVGSVGFPAGVMIACTWNEDLARSFGEGIADMAEEMNVSGWYAPAMNIHRTPFGGRNFEYYSEDGLLSGRIASSAANAASARGIYPYIKHFALNDQETGRWEMICTWSSEQAMRELYFKPFEICVKDNLAQGGASAGHPMAVMSSYNYIGTQWAGACSNLLNNVLRDEWGFRGSVLTDYFANFGYMDATRSIYNGGSTCLINQDVTTNNVTDTSNPLTVQQMRQACKDILYTGVNSRGHAPENIDTSLMSWQIILIAADVALAVVVVLLEVAVFKAYKKKSQATAESTEIS